MLCDDGGGGSGVKDPLIEECPLLPSTEAMNSELLRVAQLGRLRYCLRRASGLTARLPERLQANI